MTGTSAALDLAQAEGRDDASAAAGLGRLRSSRDVRAVFVARCAVGSRYAVVHVRRRDDAGPARATAVAGKAVGNAVARNRVKRRLRAALQACAMPAGADIVVVGRATTLTAPSDELRAAVCGQLDAAWSKCR